MRSVMPEGPLPLVSDRSTTGRLPAVGARRETSGTDCPGPTRGLAQMHRRLTFPLVAAVAFAVLAGCTNDKTTASAKSGSDNRDATSTTEAAKSTASFQARGSIEQAMVTGAKPGT